MTWCKEVSYFFDGAVLREPALLSAGIYKTSAGGPGDWLLDGCCSGAGGGPTRSASVEIGPCEDSDYKGEESAGPG